MKSILVALVIFALISVTFAHSHYITRRGEFSSNNVDQPIAGKFRLDGAGEISVTYDSKADVLSWSYSQNFWEGFGPFSNLVFTYGADTLTLDTSVGGSNNGEHTFDWGSGSSATDAENAFIAGLESGEYSAQFDATAYPNGIARAYLNNAEKFGTKRLDFVGVLTSELFTSTGAVKATFDRDSASLTFTFNFKWTEKTADKQKANPTAISSIILSNSFDNNVAYRFTPDSNGKSAPTKYTVTVETNYRFYSALRAGGITVTVNTTGGNAPTLEGEISAVVNKLSN